MVSLKGIRERYLVVQAGLLLFWLIIIFIVILVGRVFLSSDAQVAALASLITILGVSTNSYFQSLGRREREKLKREFEIKKSVYMELAEAIAKRWVYLAKLRRFDLTDAQTIIEDPSLGAAANRIRLFGGRLTLQLFEELNNAFTSFDIDARQERRKVSTLIAEIKQIDGQFQKNQELMTQVNTYLQNVRPTALLGGYTATEQQQIQQLQAQFSKLSTDSGNLVNRRKQLYDDAMSAEQHFRKQFIEGMSRIQPMVIDLLISLRRELDVELDTEWYLEFSRNIRDAMKQKLIDAAAAYDRADKTD